MKEMNVEVKKRLPLITTILVIVNIAVFLVADFVFFQEQERVVAFMALNPALVLEEGEYWRLFTSMFYHFNIEHVMFNMLMLYFSGAILEPFFGRLRFFILYFVSGLLADVALIIYNSVIVSENAEVVFAAGASGAVYGLLGAFSAVILLLRDRVPEGERRRLPLMVLLLLFGNIFNKSVGHAAHFGGFFAGAALGAGYCMYLRRRQGRKHGTKE